MFCCDININYLSKIHVLKTYISDNRAVWEIMEPGLHEASVTEVCCCG